jgi:prevent-host-death family protein
MQSIHVGVREAKISLSKLLKMVKNGNEIILTDRGRPVGKIVPLEEESLPLDVRIKRLEEQGVIGTGVEKTRQEIPPPIPLQSGIAQKLLQEDRDDVNR